MSVTAVSQPLFSLYILGALGAALCAQPAYSQAAYSQAAWTPPPGHPTIALWPNGAPDSRPNPEPEVDKTTAKDNLIAGKPLIRLGNVSTPTITLYAVKNAAVANPAVVVFPGGGYSILAIDLEGSEVCEWLNSINVSCVLLKYRVPNSGPYPAKSPAALQDAQRALSLVRSHAAEWHIDPQRLGVLGFSAGGHLAASISTNYDQRVYAPSKDDAADRLSCRPDFAVLVYPAYLYQPSSEPSPTLALRPGLPITADTPPTILVQAEDDGAAPVENSLAWFLALKRAKVAAEMHLFTSGGHGYGLRRTALPVTAWPTFVETWLHTIKILP